MITVLFGSLLIALIGFLLVVIDDPCYPGVFTNCGCILLLCSLVISIQSFIVTDTIISNDKANAVWMKTDRELVISSNGKLFTYTDVYTYNNFSDSVSVYETYGLNAYNDTIDTELVFKF